MSKLLVWLIAYGVCPLLGGLIIWWKQGKFLTDTQPFALLLFGPLSLFFALMPRSMFTSREQYYGTAKENDHAEG